MSIIEVGRSGEHHVVGDLCPCCGRGRLEWEDRWEETLVCPVEGCGYSEAVNDEENQDGEDYEDLYPTEDEVNGTGEEIDEGESYEEVYGELQDD